jgi:hypothetical protein
MLQVHTRRRKEKNLKRSLRSSRLVKADSRSEIDLGSQRCRFTIVPDFPLVDKSFNLSYAGNDL